MQGGIYTREKCPICGGKINKRVRDGIVCPNHPEIRASKFITKFKKTFINFKSFDKAERFLTFLQVGVSSYDPRDYQKDIPLGFSNLMEKYWKDKTVESTNRRGEKERKIKKGTKKNYTGYKKYFCSYFKNRNIKEIAEDEGLIDDAFNNLVNVGNKTKDNYRSFLNDFFTWVWSKNRKAFLKAQVLQPELEPFKYTLGYRKRVSKEVQYEILEEIKRISYHINPKIYLGVKWLCTYISVRPGEMIALKEGDINLMTYDLNFPSPKENEWKSVPLIPEDVEIIRSMPRGLPPMPFFRHVKGISGVAENEPFGEKYLYKWWVKGCSNLGIKGVDLYGGTKHSTTTALAKKTTSGKKYSPEQIRKFGTQQKTNKAFDRYFDTDDEQARDLYIDAVPKKVATILQPNISDGENGKLLNFKD